MITFEDVDRLVVEITGAWNERYSDESASFEWAEEIGIETDDFTKVIDEIVAVYLSETAAEMVNYHDEMEMAECTIGHLRSTVIMAFCLGYEIRRQYASAAQ